MSSCTFTLLQLLNMKQSKFLLFYSTNSPGHTISLVLYSCPDLCVFGSSMEVFNGSVRYSRETWTDVHLACMLSG